MSKFYFISFSNETDKVCGKKTNLYEFRLYKMIKHARPNGIKKTIFFS